MQYHFILGGVNVVLLIQKTRRVQIIFKATPDVSIRTINFEVTLCYEPTPFASVYKIRLNDSGHQFELEHQGKQLS